MAGPEGYNPSDPHLAEAYITPEGYDVAQDEGAEKYLTEVHRFILPEAEGEIDASTGYHLVLALQREKRAALYADGLTQQNVAEHTAKLNVTTVWKAYIERPDLEHGKVSIMSAFHDLVEAYAKDTVINDDDALASKPWREKAGMTLLKRDIRRSNSPHAEGLIEILDEYKEGNSPEARYVNAMDKVEAYQLALNNKAALHRERWEDYRELVAHALPKAIIDKTAYSLMKDVMKQLGRMWHKWGCMPFEGDYNEIVDTIAAEVESEYAAKRLALEGINAIVSAFTGETSLPPEGIVQQAIDQDFASKAGNITLLASKRHNKPTPPPPTPPATPAFGIAGL